jgi:hypothetical protein
VSSRDHRGRFAAGNQGGPGRPPRQTEHEYLRAVQDSCSLEDVRAITAEAVKRAKAGDARAREWISRYLVGTPHAMAPTPSDARFHEEVGKDPLDARLADYAITSSLLSDFLPELA